MGWMSKQLRVFLLERFDSGLMLPSKYRLVKFSIPKKKRKKNGSLKG